jgi:translation initiation factor IF-2
MAETNSNSPEGAVPPKPPEAAKVQPKKETVRITLPPKPTAAPTIKIPAPAIAAATAKAPAAAPAAAAPAAAAPAARAGGAAPAPRPAMAPRPAVAAVSGLDKGLAIAAVVLSVAVVVRLVLITMAP